MKEATDLIFMMEGMPPPKEQTRRIGLVSTMVTQGRRANFAYSTRGCPGQACSVKFA